MPIRNGLLSTLRARGRTALFVLLILVLTVALSLGLGMWAYCGALLARMEEQYTSVALVEYMGEDYPDADAADSGSRAALELLDQEAIAATDGVELWEQTKSTLVSVSGYRNSSVVTPYSDNAVIVASIKAEYTTGYGAVDEADLPESRAILYSVAGDNDIPDGSFILPDGNIAVWNGYYVFYLPDMEPLRLPCYYLGDGVSNQRQGVLSGDGIREKEPEDLYVLWHRVTVREGTSSRSVYRDDVIGELPAGYDRETLQNLLENARYYYVESSDTYMGDNETILSDRSYGRISRALYSPYGADNMLSYFTLADSGFVPEEGKSYLLNGSFVSWGVGSRSFEVQPFPDSDARPWLELSGEDDPALTEGIFAEHATFYSMANNTAVLTASDHITALEEFQQGHLYLNEGRFPQAGEKGVCVISGGMAEYLTVGVGDTVSLEILDSDPGERYKVTATGDQRSLEIVGITNPSADYPDRLWVSDAESGFPAPLFGYSLGRAVLDNRKAVQAAEELPALLPAGVQLTMYDQGYTAAARPIRVMESAARAVTLAAAIGALAVLTLFAFLFVGRQRETVGVLVSLGTPVGKIRVWLLSGASAVSGAAALAGAVIGSLTLSRVVTAAMETAKRLYHADTRYSEAVVGLVRESEEMEAVPGWPALAAGLTVFFAALMLCLIFLRHARKENAPKKGQVLVRVPRGCTSTRGQGPLRFAVLSARRGGRRSVIVIVAALVLTLFVSLLSASAQSRSGQMESLYADSVLGGQVISFNGRKQTGLAVPTRDIQQLWKSGNLKDIFVSRSWPYEYTTEESLPDITPTTSVLEDKAVKILRMPRLSTVNSLSAAEEFYYTDRPEIRWLEGWDESCLSDESCPAVIESIYERLYEEENYVPSDYIYPVIVGSRFLEDNDLKPGDMLTLRLYMYLYVDSRELLVEWPVNFRIVGSFTSVGAKDNVYAPLSLWCSPEWLYGEGDKEMPSRDLGRIMNVDSLKKSLYFRIRFETCRFTLRSAYKLEDLRDWLAEQQYSQVGVTNRNRVTVLLRDQNFVETVGGLNRYISFSSILFPALFLVVGLLGFIISWLMVSSRRMELAIMRGLGASPLRAFASFFLEQAALCLLGCIIGVLAMTLLYPGVVLWLAGAGFLACYLAGCALSVLTAGRTNLMMLLSERE